MNDTTTYTVFNRNTGDFASADRGLSLEDEPLHVTMPDGTIGDEESTVQTIAFAIRADLMARRMKSAA